MVKLADNKVARVVAMDGDAVKILEKKYYSMTLNKVFSLMLDNVFEIGKCACCGGTSKIFFHGNVIAFACNAESAVKVCKFHDDGCPGISACVNLEDHDTSFRDKKIKKTREILDAMLEIYDMAIIEIDAETKEILASGYLTNPEYIIRTYVVAMDDTPDFYVIEKNKKLIENRTAMASRTLPNIKSPKDEKNTT